jgi:replication fork protection complex subunit Tof1/Swi1
MLRRARNKEKKGQEDDEDAPRDGFINDSEGEEEFLFPDNPRKKRAKNIIEELKARRKRKRGEGEEGEDEIDEEVAAQRRAAREAAARERRLKIKSEAYIRDSDDESDAERDRLFFEREEQVRSKQEENIRKQMALGTSEEAAKRRKERKRQKAPTAEPPEAGQDSDDDLLMVDPEDEPNETASSQPRRKSDTEDETGDEDTPLSSQSSATARDLASGKMALREIAQARTVRDAGTRKRVVDTAADEGESDEDIITTARRRQVRGGFLVDSDDEDDE